MADQIISFEGENYRVLSRGITNDEGETYCHLASTTKFRVQRNGKVPHQLCVFVPETALAS